MKKMFVLCILVQVLIVEGMRNSTRDERLLVPRTAQPTPEPENRILFYLTIPVGVLALIILIIVLYIKRKRRGALRRRRRTAGPTMNISVPAESAVSNLMGNAMVDVMAVATCTAGNPQVKSKLLHTFNDEERFRGSFNDDENFDMVGPMEYVNTKDFNHGQNTRAFSSQSNTKRSHNMKTGKKSGRVESAGLKKTPFIPPAISVELVRRQSETNPDLERGQTNKKGKAFLPDWEYNNEQLIYENQKSALVRQAKSVENFSQQVNLEPQALYMNSNQALTALKKDKSVEDFSENQWMPELPLKQKLKRADGFSGQTSTWEKSKSPDYENFFEGDCVGGSWQRGAIHQRNKNRTHFIGQAAKPSHLNDDVDYENLPSGGENLLPPKTKHISTPCVAQNATSLESQRRGTGFTRKDNKAVRRSKTNLEAVLKPCALAEQKRDQTRSPLKSVSNESHQTNTESLMQMLGLPINLNYSDQVKTFQDEGYLPADDYDDNWS